MKFSEVVAQTLDWLQRDGRVSYRALKREFELDDDYIEDLKAEIVQAKRLAVDEDGVVLVWIGATPVQSTEFRVPSPTQSPTPNPQPPAGERRQLTVQFIDLVGSTALSTQLDPEELREVIQAYRETCATVIRRFDGYLAKYIGDGLLVYFGYPVAHEDDAQRAVRTGLEIIEVLRTRSFKPLVSHPLQVRIGIHTGLVVAGEMGVGDQPEPLGIVGETPNIAARIQGLAAPNTVILSAATHRLVGGHFECQPFGSHLVKGIATPLAVYHVQSERQHATPFGGNPTLTPLVGREQEVGLLVDRWEQVKEGRGQVVLLSGEPGIGKSRLAYTLKEQVTAEGSLLFEARCSSYHQHSALYPLIDVVQRTVLLTRHETDEEKSAKLERALALYGMQETLPLFTALLSLPPPSQYPPLNLTPQKQKERTLQTMVQLFIAQAERQATVSVWEDLHWADPSSLEFLTLLIDQMPTTKLLLVLTFRPEFLPPWKPRSHITQLTLNRLGKKHVEAMIAQVAARDTLPVDVIKQIRVKTDGVPLFVEELTKAVLEAEGVGARRAVPLHTVPATLQEALLARLDRLSTARQVAQLGATLGREFSYELLHAVFALSATEVHTALSKLVEAEILYQRGSGEQARYFFKHALIQDMAYQSLLKSKRQQYHQQIAQVLGERFPETVEAQPELLAHHYTEAGFIAQAILYWQRAGQRAVQRSANIEAISHLTKGLELFKTLPDTPERAPQELMLQLTLGVPLQATKGWGVPEVKRAYARARELCQQIGETPQLFPVLWGLAAVYIAQAEHKTGRALAEQCRTLAQSVQDPNLLLLAHTALGISLFHLGELVPARKHLEQGITFYDPQQHRSLAFLYGSFDSGVACLSFAAWSLWHLGYPDQALQRSQEALTLAQEIAHPFSLGFALFFAAATHQFRREVQATQERAEAAITFSTDQMFPEWIALGTLFRGWALTEQGQEKEGIAQMRQGLTAHRDIGAEVSRSYYLGLLAEAYGRVGQAEEGLKVIAEALAFVSYSEERYREAELYRLKGELTLQSKVESEKSKEEEAEACFLKAIEIARKQQAKSLELRATMSLSRLWQQQGKKDEAQRMLAEIYNWFTEGFDTKDLQEAKALLEELSH